MKVLSFVLYLAAASAIELRVDDTGGYTVYVGSDKWLQSGETSFYNAGSWVSTKGLRPKMTRGNGSDPIGTFQSTSFTWNTLNGFSFETNFRVYDSDDLIGFEQVWLTGGEDTKTGDSSSVLSAFPAFQNSNASLKSMGWHGTFIDDSTSGPSIGEWPQNAVVGKDGGPNVLFKPDTTDAVVLSAMSNFMSHTTAITAKGDLACGIMGSVTEVPVGFTITTMLYHGRNGVNNAMTEWGQKLLTFYGKKDGRKDDLQVSTLGYNTDHGAYYYYKTEPNTPYSTTLKDVQQYAKVQKIPYRWVLLDSWWYYKGAGGGVTNWTVRPDIFPEHGGGDAGLLQFHKDTKWPIMGHNRYWSYNSPYAKQNGGEFAFSEWTTEKEYIVPLEQRFWDWLLGKSKKWGLAVYEQDWLYNEFNGVPMLTSNATMARTWLMQMGQAAERNNLTIQYCMAYPRHALQSVEIPAVTQIRASDDYVPSTKGTPRNWNIGGSSILAHALALAPFKDNYWTNSSEPGGSCGNAVEPGVALHSAVSTLSAGPVTPSDGIGFSNVELIMRSCRADGKLLQPSRPTTYTDGYIHGVAMGTWAPSGHVWSTYSTIGSTARWDLLFSHQLESPYSVTPDMLTLDSTKTANTAASAARVAYALNTKSLAISSLQVQAFDAKQPFTTSPTAYDPNNGFEIWHVADVLDGSTWALLGELSKWVPVAANRVQSVEVATGQLEVTIVGTAGEEVELFFADTTTVAAATTGKKYSTHPDSYCDDHKGDGKHTHAYTSDIDTLEQCRAVCDKLDACTCFDYQSKQRSNAHEKLYKCRVENATVGLTHSASGYSAYEPITPAPPAPPQLKTKSVKCKIGANGKAMARMPIGTCS